MERMKMATRPADEIIREVKANQDKINAVRHGRVTFVIQDGRVVRAECSDGWLARKAN